MWGEYKRSGALAQDPAADCSGGALSNDGEEAEACSTQSGRGGRAKAAITDWKHARIGGYVPLRAAVESATLFAREVGPEGAPIGP